MFFPSFSFELAKSHFRFTSMHVVLNSGIKCVQARKENDAFIENLFHSRIATLSVECNK